REWPYGRRYVYVRSRGDELRLRTGSVDVFFAGECVEHVENIELFLAEIHRVLRPGGLFVLTTPNADAYLYRVRGERYGASVYHHEAASISYAGPWEVAPLHRSMTGRMATGGDASEMTLDFQGTDLLVFLWSHTWSGYGFVEVDGACSGPVNLYGSQGGFRRL